jgi:uncharacterized protein YggE
MQRSQNKNNKMQNENLKHYFWLLLDAFLAVAVAGLLFFAFPIAGRYKDSLYPTRNMTVTAEGKTLVSPDIATASFSVVSRGKNPDELAERNNKLVSQAIDFVKSQGVEAKDIRTTGYNLSPDYAYDENARRSYITGYTLAQTVTVKVRNLEGVGKILGGLPELGINQIGGVSFGVDEPEKYLAEAREKAFRLAREKAEAMARAAGVKLGRVISANEYQPGPVYPYAYGEKAYGMGGGGVSAAPPTIEPGSEEITVSVTLSYELR